MALKQVQRAFDAAGEGKADRIEPPHEFLHHRAQRRAIDAAHGAHLFGQRRLKIVGERGQRQVAALGQQEPHDDGGLLPSGHDPRVAPGGRLARVAVSLSCNCRHGSSPPRWCDGRRTGLTAAYE